MKPSNRGFTLLEVIIALSILLTIGVASTTMLRNSINMRQAISEKAKVAHRVNLAMQKVTYDLQHAYIISTLRTEFNIGGRATKTVFRVKRTLGDSSELSLTTMTHKPFSANSFESDETYVVYRLQEDKNQKDLYNLWRGETKVLPDSFSEDIPMQVLAKNIKTFKVWPWNGDSWEKDRWDTDRSDWRNKLPSMVLVEIEAYDDDPQEDERIDNSADRPVVKTSTIVAIPRSYGTKEPKEGSKTIRWY